MTARRKYDEQMNRVFKQPMNKESSYKGDIPEYKNYGSILVKETERRFRAVYIREMVCHNKRVK